MESKRLERFYLPGLKEVGTELGHGSYAVVFEYQLHGLKCAGKKLQAQLCNTNPEEREELVSRFEEECDLLSSIRHPNIVQFLGLSHDRETGTPILVMEFLETSLTISIELNGILPDEFNYSIANDIVTALCFLHGQTEPIIHRDLTSNNILLTASMTAKIADLGVARILNFSYFRRNQMTTCPGTVSYMPPEALAHEPAYDCSIDIFSVGVLLLHMLCGEWPIPGEANRVDPQNPTILLPLTEKERRIRYISMLSPAHPLLNTIEQCLSNYPPHRPTAKQILEKIRSLHKPETLDKLQMAKELKQLLDENEQSLKQKDEVLQTLQKVTRMKELSEELVSVKDDALAAKEEQLVAMRKEIAAREREISIKDGLLAENTLQPIANKGMPIQFQLRYHKDFHKRIIGNPNCIVFQNMLYMGAGHSEVEQDGHLILSYDDITDSWNQLPPTPHALFGLGCLDEGIVAVGGVTKQQYVTQEVYMLDTKTKIWSKMHPSLPTARFRPTVVSYQNSIVVCGGINSNNKVFGLVDVFVSGSDHWYTAPSLPIPCAIAKPVIIGKYCYLVGGYKKWRPSTPSNSVQCISLFNILVPGTEGSWKLLQDTPNDRPVPVSLGGALMVIGGWNEGPRDEIYLYSEKTDKWIQVGTWSTPFRSGGSATLPSGESIVIGGLADSGKKLSQVVTLSLSYCSSNP